MNDGIRLTCWRGYIWTAKRGACAGTGESIGEATTRLKTVEFYLKKRLEEKLFRERILTRHTEE
jgi:hypothetical protein